MTPNHRRPFLTLPEVAALLHVRDRYVYDLVAQAAIPHYRVGRRLRFDPEEVDAWLRASRSFRPRPVADLGGFGGEA